MNGVMNCFALMRLEIELEDIVDDAIRDWEMPASCSASACMVSEADYAFRVGMSSDTNRQQTWSTPEQELYFANGVKTRWWMKTPSDREKSRREQEARGQTMQKV